MTRNAPTGYQAFASTVPFPLPDPPKNGEKEPWCTIRAMAGEDDAKPKAAEILIRGTIGLPKWLQEYGYEAAGTFQDFENELRDLPDSVERINLRVYSGGGDVFTALAIHDVLSRHSAEVVATVDGLAASAASFLILAADRIEMPSNAYLMIHNAWSCVCGDYRDFQEAADKLERWTEDIAKLYQRRMRNSAAGGDEGSTEIAAIREMMDAETWLSGDQARDLGLIDTVTDEVELAACAGALGMARRPVAGFDVERMPLAARALFDSPTEPLRPASQENKPAKNSSTTPPDPDPMKLTAAQRARLIALLNLGDDIDPAEKSERDFLSNLASDSNELEAIQAEAEEAAAAGDEGEGSGDSEGGDDSDSGEGEGGDSASSEAGDEGNSASPTDQITAAVQAAVQPLQDEINELKSQRAAGVNGAAWGGGKPANAGGADDGNNAEELDPKTANPRQLIAAGRKKMIGDFSGSDQSAA